MLDLRGNGGGLLEQAVDIVGNFVPKGTEVPRTRGRDSSTEKIYKTTHTPIFPDIPLAVLIDGGSASAAEITAGFFRISTGSRAIRLEKFRERSGAKHSATPLRRIAQSDCG